MKVEVWVEPEAMSLGWCSGLYVRMDLCAPGKDVVGMVDKRVDEVFSPAGTTSGKAA
jgi:hypothetical protein